MRFFLGTAESGYIKDITRPIAYPIRTLALHSQAFRCFGFVTMNCLGIVYYSAPKIIRRTDPPGRASGLNAVVIIRVAPLLP